MANENNANAGCFGGGLGLLCIGTFFIFLILKLAEIGQVATWSWWWVTAPLWGYFAFIGAVLGIFLFLVLVFLTLRGIVRWLHG